MATKIVEVHPGIYEIFLPLPMRPTIINVYLIDCHGAWALVDTGMHTPESITALEEAFAEVGIKLEDLDVICAVLGCGVEELLIPEPDKVASPAGDGDQPSAAVAGPAA